MARNELIQAILEAWWDWEYSEPANKTASKKKFYDLLHAAIGDRDYTPRQLMEFLHDRYYGDFKKSRKWQERRMIAQSALKKRQ